MYCVAFPCLSLWNLRSWCGLLPKYGHNYSTEEQNSSSAALKTPLELQEHNQDCSLVRDASVQHSGEKKQKKPNPKKNTEEELLVMGRINISEKYISVISDNPHE